MCGLGSYAVVVRRELTVGELAFATSIAIIVSCIVNKQVNLSRTLRGWGFTRASSTFRVFLPLASYVTSDLYVRSGVGSLHAFLRYLNTNFTLALYTNFLGWGRLGATTGRVMAAGSQWQPVAWLQCVSLAASAER